MVVFNIRFTDDINMILKRFAYDNKNKLRHIVKTEWEKLIKCNDNQFKLEFKRIKEIGYNGDYDDMIQKMYNSARYYYMKNKKAYNNILELFGKKKKKMVTFKLDEEYPKQLEQKQKNIRFSKSVLNQISTHIKEYMRENQNLKPQEFYENFIQTHNELYHNEENKFITNHQLTTQHFINRFKKTYKNQLYKIKNDL